jgi:phosphoserine phosphatase
MATKVALVYDFDGTLAPDNMQGHGLLAALGHETELDFWTRGTAIAKAQDADEVLVYMWRILEDARSQGIPVTKDMLASFGAKVPLFPGVDTWFQRINKFGVIHELDIQHYIVSSGLFEMIQGCRIAHEFHHIFASKYMYAENGDATAPGVAINYTTKTQYLFRINKGILNSSDRKSLNGFTPEDERPIPFERMIFLGDGDTDIPTMKMITYKGGESIGVFGNWEKAAERQLIHRLIEEDRVKRVAPADYREDTQLDVMVKGLLGRIARAAGWKPARET